MHLRDDALYNLDVGAFTAVQFMSFEDDLTFGIEKICASIQHRGEETPSELCW
jgi:hypothetical protein